MPRRPPAHLLKSNRTYTFQEAAYVLGVSIETIRRWARREGLPYLSAGRPYLIIGSELKKFLRGRGVARKRKLKPSEFYCVSCKEPREPLGMMADYIPITDTRGRLQALCPVCGGICNRLVSANNLPQLAEIFDLNSVATGKAKRTP